MTNVTVYKPNDKFLSVEISGHTGYSESGSDIVCAAISTLAQSTLLGLKKVVGLKIKEIKNEKKGYLSFRLPEIMSETQEVQAYCLTDTFEESLKDLVSGYPEFIQMEVRRDVY